MRKKDEQKRIQPPEWALDLKIDPELYSQLVSHSLRKRTSPAQIAREWIHDSAVSIVKKSNKSPQQ